MASEEDNSSSSDNTSNLVPGPFLLRSLLDNVPLSADGTEEDIKINCVDYYDGNLYVGTSAAELLHFVQIPPDPNDASSTSSFILASRLRPQFAESANLPPAARPGVQQIVLLPPVGKACVLCNYTVTFYSLPELSPVFREVKNCNWIGGVDLSEDVANDSQSPRVTILLSLNRRLQVVMIGESPRAIKNIEFAGSILSARRDAIACVADARSYALVHVEHQLKIPLMSISSLDQPQGGPALGQVQNLQVTGADSPSRSASTAQAHSRAASSISMGGIGNGGGGGGSAAHSRSTSLGGLISTAAAAATARSSSDESTTTTTHDTSPPLPPLPQGGGGGGGGGTGGGAAGAVTGTGTGAGTGPGTQGSQGSGSDEAGSGSTSVPAGQTITARAASPAQRAAAARPVPGPLKPLIASPTPEEFLLVTGTGPSDPGIGMFVNLDGDPTRPTLEFSRYPYDIVVDGGGQDVSSSRLSLNTAGGSGEDEEEGYVLASISKDTSDGQQYGLEIQRWDVNVGEDEAAKTWLEIPGKEAKSPIGIHALVGANDFQVYEVVQKLCQRRIVLPTEDVKEEETEEQSSKGKEETEEQPSKGKEETEEEQPSKGKGKGGKKHKKKGHKNQHAQESSSEQKKPTQATQQPAQPKRQISDEEAKRNKAEEEFVARFTRTTGRIAVWYDCNIWWAMKNPLVLQLEAGLSTHLQAKNKPPQTSDERRPLYTVLGSFRGRDAKDELEFVTFNYIRQRAGALLFMSLLDRPEESNFPSLEIKALEEVLLESGLDPRVVLSLVPGLRDEIIESPGGIWVYGGVKDIVKAYLEQGRHKGSSSKTETAALILQFLRRFLIAWRRKKGFGSVADESDVFQTVDAALLSVLLTLDKDTPKGQRRAIRTGSVQADLNDVVDNGVDCFDRAVTLLEEYHRLFVLSRLYQSRKMAGDVLRTWRRIIEGERDDGGELQDKGEQRVREYLTKVSNQALVQEYGLWLANRNPKLGVQVFADDNDRRNKTRAPKFEPGQVVALLRKEAPGAVRYYLEYLVFSKGHSMYVDELILYYVDVVTQDLVASADVRDTVRAVYEAYRALQAPKPTFRQFITDNLVAEKDEMWQNRLRLLELLGGPYPYDVSAVRDKLASSLPADEPAEQLLVPETIILNGREHRHEDALRLLVHGLGDYDTAIAYCLHGGASLYARRSGSSVEGSEGGGGGGGGGTSQGERPKRRESLPPTVELQTKLFRVLLLEFLNVEDVSDRVEQTGSLLTRFAGWFDVLDVLELLPDQWAVDVAGGFLVQALRALVRDRNESMVLRALSGAENLRVHDEAIAKAEEKGPTVELE